MGHDKNGSGGPQIISSSRPFFLEMVSDGLDRRRMIARPETKAYIVNILEHYMLAANLKMEPEETGASGTMAEMFLRASGSESGVRAELLRKLGDTSLYISGFFGDSLHRKLVDIDYYAGIGGTAYATLATVTPEETAVQVFNDLSQRFLDYVEVLTYISQQAMIQTDEDLLRLYSRYLVTGSKLAEEQLIERGMITPPVAAAKSSKQ
jgi:hypothetical protein